MKSIGHLNGLRRTAGCTIRIVERAVTRDDLDARMVFKPAGEAGCRSIGQQIHRLMTRQIDQQRAIRLAFAKSEIIHAEDRWRWMRQLGCPAGEPQQGARAHGHALAGRDAGGGLAALVKGQVALFGEQPLRATGGGGHKCW